MIKKVKTNGRGKDIPPDLLHVKVWFLQNSSSEKMAIDFYRFYDKKKWCGGDHRKIRDWKMYAWYWFWKK